LELIHTYSLVHDDLPSMITLNVAPVENGISSETM
jgi:hypothetical protein